MEKTLTILLICTLLLRTTPALNENSTEQIEDWAGKWFPHKPNEVDSNTIESPKVSDVKNEVPIVKPDLRIPMGVIDKNCDDGKTNLGMDDNDLAHLCFMNRTLFNPDAKIDPTLHLYNIPEEYSALHRCMNESIEYDATIPTFGTHRALWPKYGEYSYVPVQRWLHNLEHGAVVMLYHPCANKVQLDQLKSIVSSCLYRHVITPSERLGSKRPFALVAWGAVLEMSVVQKDLSVDFIKTYALKGPEKTSREGQFDNKLLELAKIVSTINDDELCPNYVFF